MKSFKEFNFKKATKHHIHKKHRHKHVRRENSGEKQPKRHIAISQFKYRIHINSIISHCHRIETSEKEGYIRDQKHYIQHDYSKSEFVVVAS